MKTSFITTIFNEEKTIKKFLESVLKQTKLPDEIIIVDGGSTDKTTTVISGFKASINRKRKLPQITLLIKKGNRAVGRNEAIMHATGNIILCSDSGNILDNKWVENITKPFKDSSVDVVAGYYKGRAKTAFQKCLLPYALVMEDVVHPKKFLPATRSIAFTKSIWKKVGGFHEEFSHNEDYVFAKNLEEKRANIVFAQEAIVYWMPRKTYKEAFIMFFRFAFGDAEAKITRPKVLLLLGRYIFGLYLLFLSFLYHSVIGVGVIFSLLFLYTVWSIKKNYKYVKKKQSFFHLPLLQFTADAAVLAGTVLGMGKVVKNISYLRFFKHNTFLFFIGIIYFLTGLITLQWGIPNAFHPFPYHMDEWHQLQSVANTFRFGTPNTVGSANGTMFHFLLSGFYLIPFTLVKYIDPFSLQIDNAVMRERIFEILRFQTIIFGSLTIFVFYQIMKFLKLQRKFFICMFVFTPIWITLSGYFKYDIALLFWIIFSYFFIIRFSKTQNGIDFVFAGITGGLALATKVSAVPLVIIYLLSYFWFKKPWNKELRYFFIGMGILFGVIVAFGMPDTLFGKGNILDYLFGNIAPNAAATQNYRLGMDIFSYLIFVHFPALFGHGLMLLGGCSLLFWIYLLSRQQIKKSLRDYKTELFILFSFLIFLISILSLQIGGLGNRSLVLLPFLILVVAVAFKQFSKLQRNQIFLHCILIGVIILQLFESFNWLYVKLVQSPQQKASMWIEQHISKGEKIGIESIPIYQYLPDNIQKEFYFEQYHVISSSTYKYEVISSQTKNLPSILVISNDTIEDQLLKKSPKRDLLRVIEQKEYKKIAEFSPDFLYNGPLLTKNDYFLSGIVTTPLTISIYKAALD